VTSGVTGLMFPPGDANALAAQVRWAVSNPSALAELSCRAYASYEERYTPEVNFNQLIGIYRSVARDRRFSGQRHSDHGQGTQIERCASSSTTLAD
jgi:glycosyltransferase involved in cell wall biosynthesis